MMKRLFIFLSFVMVTNMWAPSVSELMKNFQKDVAQVGIDVEDAFGTRTKPTIAKKPAHLRPKPAVPKKPADLSDKVKAKAAAAIVQKKMAPPVVDRSQCGVCMENLNFNDPASLVTLSHANGKHKFCKECIQPWVHIHNHDNCPSCRTTLTPDELDNLRPPLSVKYLLDNGQISPIEYGLLDLTDKGIESLDGLKEIPGIENATHIDLNYNKLETLDPTTFEDLTALESINLNYNKLESIDPGAFTGLTALESINLKHNKLESIDPGTFTGLTALESINLSGNKLEVIDPATFTGLTALKVIDLINNKLEKLNPGTLTGLIALHRIELSGNKLKTLNPGTFTGLTTLGRINLSGNKLEIVDPATFTGLTALRSIDLWGNPLLKGQIQNLESEMIRSGSSAKIF